MAEEGRTGGWREGAVGLSGDPGSATMTVDDVTSDQALVIRDPTDGLFRCEWAGNDPLMIAYHDDMGAFPPRRPRSFRTTDPRGVPGRSLVVDDPASARRSPAFDGFDPAIVAEYGPDDVARLLVMPASSATVSRWPPQFRTRRRSSRPERVRLIRCLHLAVCTGRAWAAAKSLGDIPATTAESDAMSKDLKRRGFRFVGAPSAMPSCRVPGSLTTTSKAASEPRHPENLPLA